MGKKVKVLDTQSCPTLWNPIYCSLLDSSVHRILQARLLEWVAIPFSSGSFWPRDQTLVSCIAGGFFTIRAGGKPQVEHKHLGKWTGERATTLLFLSHLPSQKKTGNPVWIFFWEILQDSSQICSHLKAEVKL